MARALLIIDIQRDYFPGGSNPLVEPERAAENARRLLDAFRESQEPILHLQHIWDAPEATFMRPGTDGVRIHPLVEPAEGEAVLEKAAPNGFVGTSLERDLRAAEVDSVVVAGMMSSMCVDATVRAGADLGFAMTVVHDACAAPDLTFGRQAIDGATVHAAFMAALADGYGSVVAAGEFLSEDRDG